MPREPAPFRWPRFPQRPVVVTDKDVDFGVDPRAPIGEELADLGGRSQARMNEIAQKKHACDFVLATEGCEKRQIVAVRLRRKPKPARLKSLRFSEVQISDGKKLPPRPEEAFFRKKLKILTVHFDFHLVACPAFGLTAC